ncbi:MAG TPA: PEPxxWA-CTERM sorting domain-containing protein [Phenylobacterium sp.]|jgi:hypothetical protein|uniref:PEPxxWA-CTERM sorting domain-containing protein n=1 Tax=Phenylobacterium sp. TaxID=1871053 RepID=UPI002B96A8FC|nr:PEPxxWA-CTERM sorting domain-containing protein [Phenylobacterium sp.]HXA40475.1 PEPxxWA-CTERM sorting domain-containing protein [Phenylobacterium sp.]
MTKRFGLLAATAIACVGAFGGAQAATLTPIPSYVDPAGGTTSVLGINNAGWMTGNIAEANGSSLGFVRDAAGNYTTFSANGLFATYGRAIDNSNTVIGYATDAAGAINTDTQFTRTTGGAVTALQNPNTGVPLHGIAQGVNATGAIVGDYYSGPGATTPLLGYVLDGSTFTTLTAPGSTRTAARGIEDDGTVAGWAIVGGVQEGFIEQGGAYSFFQAPDAGSVGTVFEDINNNGLVSGEWMDAGGDSHAFVFNSVADAFTDIDVLGATSTSAFGLNDAGDVVVTASGVAEGPNNFLYHADAVPEPTTWAMLILGFFGLGGLLRRRNAALAV